MKNIIFPLLLFCFYSSIAQVSVNDFEQKLAGEWTIINTANEVSGEEIVTSCNVCPKVTFTLDGQEANLTKPDGTQEVYLWSISNNMIVFADMSTRISETEDATFNGQYKITFTQQKDFLELKITDADKHFWCTLRK